MTPQEAIDRIKNHNEIHSRKEQHFAVHITEALNMACDALEKQIAKKPAVFKDYSQGRYTVAFCPNCKKLLGLLNMAKTDERCVKCGQALDWSDTE